MKGKKVLIVEDEATIALDIEMRLQSLGYQVVGVLANPSGITQQLSECKPDLVLMDINLKGGDEGIGLAEEIMVQWQIPVVFLTAYTDSGTFRKAIAVNPYGFVSKPFKDADLRNAIDLAIHNHSNSIFLPKSSDKNSAKSIFVKDGSGLLQLKFEEIHWIQAYDNYCKVHLKDQQHVINLLLKEFDEKLPDTFIRVHRSFLVSASHINKITHDTVIIGDAEIPIGKAYKQKLIGLLNT